MSSNNHPPGTKPENKKVARRDQDLAEDLVLADRQDISHPNVAPWSGGALVNACIGNQICQVGTGFLCQADVLVTAKHVVINPDNPDNINVFVDYDPRNNPAVQAASIIGHAHHRVYDLTVYILGQAFPWHYPVGVALPVPANLPLTVAGYGFPYPDETSRYSSGKGNFISQNDTTFSYAMSVARGDSGAPLFTVQPGQPTVIGFHTDSASTPTGNPTGLCFTAPLVAVLNNMIALARQQIGE